jgi:hypothetical protein
MSRTLSVDTRPSERTATLGPVRMSKKVTSSTE